MTNQNSPMDRNFYRSRTDRIIGGVCGGLAEYFVIDPTLMRIIWIILGLMGIGVVAYIVCLIVMKEDPNYDPTQPKVQHNNSLLVGAGLIILGLFIVSSNLHWSFFWFRPFHWHFFHLPFFRVEHFFPLLLIALGVIYIFHVMKKNGAKEKFETDQTSADTTVRAEHDKFVRSRKNRLIGGVCGGLADYIHVDVTFVRIIWVIFTLFSHIIWGLLLYIVLLIVIPEELLVNSTESKSATAPKSVPVPKSDADSPKANTKAKPAPKSAPRKKSKDSDSEEAES